MTKPKRGRKEGTRVLYTLDQTQRYQSQWRRYEEGLKLAESGEVLKVDDETYRIPSKRSPVGYWEVKREKAAIGPLITFNHFTGIAHPNKLDTTITKQATKTILKVTSQITTVSSFYIYLQIYSVISLKNILTFPATVIVSLDYDGDGNRFTCGGATRGLGQYPKYYADCPAPNSYQLKGSGTFSYNISDLSTLKNSNLTFLVMSDSYYEEDPLPAPRKLNLNYTATISVLPGLGDKVDSSCSCPDFSKKEGVFIDHLSPTKSQPRSWSNSEAGCPTWEDGKRRCKHIVAVQSVCGDEIPIPGDIPTGSE